MFDDLFIHMFNSHNDVSDLWGLALDIAEQKPSQFQPLAVASLA